MIFEISFSLLPVFFLIAVGFIFQKISFPKDDFWIAAEQLAYYVLFPALLLGNLATADISNLHVTTLTAAIVSSMLIMSLIVVIVGWRISADGPSFTSVFQGSLRFNSFIGMGATTSLFSDFGLTIAALIIAVMVPLGNILSVVALARHAGRNSPGPGVVFLAIVRNPLILSCLAGLFLNLSNVGLPPLSEPFINILAQAALPLGLMCVGSSLDLSSIRGTYKLIFTTCSLKLFIMPILMATSCYLFEVGELASKIAILFAAVPPSPSSFVLARQLGGNASLMASIIAISTLASACTLPIAMLIYH